VHAAPRETPVPAPVREPEAQPAMRERAPEPPAPAPDPAEIERALERSGLQLVQTKPGAQQVEAPVESEFVPARRERRPRPAELGEALVQVETRKDDAPSSS